MSGENININPNTAAQAKPGLLKEMVGSTAISGTFVGFGGLTSVARNGSVKKALEATNKKGFEALNKSMKAAGKDVFTRGVELSQNYDIYKNIAKKAKNLENAAKKTDISLIEHFKNLFRKDKLTITKVRQQAADAAKELAEKKSLIASGSGIVEEGAKLAGKTSFGTAKNLFKSELKNKFVIGITILGAIPRIKEEVVPAFKEKGFIEGMKTAGKVVARTAVDFVSNAGFSAIGRTVGSAIGTVFCFGAGSAIGGMLGDVIGSFFSMKLTGKLFDKEKDKEPKAEVEPKQTEPQAENNAVQQTVEQAPQEEIKETKKVKNIDSFEVAKAKAKKLDVVSTSDPVRSVKKRHIGYEKPVNGQYKTKWVNDLKNQQEKLADYTV